MNPALLYIFSGLPGVGKSTLAKRLSETLGCAYLRIDTIEQALRELCGIAVEGEGYRLAYRVAADNLVRGVGVVADSCNPIDLTRREWEAVATDVGAAFANIEVVCSDRQEHRRRAERRTSEIVGLNLPAWEAIRAREYHPWRSQRIVVDTAGQTPAQSFRTLAQRLGLTPAVSHKGAPPARLEQTPSSR